MRGIGLSRGGGYRGGRGGGRGGGRRPPSLKGKEIGLFYRDRQIQKRKQIEKTQVKCPSHTRCYTRHIETHNYLFTYFLYTVVLFYCLVDRII